MSEIKQFTADYAEYLKDESRTIGYADSISFPKSEHEILDILGLLSKTKTRVTIQGARTGLAAAAVPFGGHIMNLGRMNKVLGLRQRGNLFYVRVQPGVILSQLRKDIEAKRFNMTGWSANSLLAAKNLADAPEQFFPTDPTESSACISGITACNASGARSYLYKSVRKHISAIRLALWDGSIIDLRRGEHHATGRDLTLKKAGGGELLIKLPSFVMPAAKNASGYYVEDNMDAIDLIIGSDGTLGVLTEIELELLPLPEFIWGVTSFFTSETDALSFVNMARAKVENMAAIEYFDGGAIAILRNQKKMSAAFSQLPDVEEWVNCCVYIELHCRDEETVLANLCAIGTCASAAGGNEENTWVARNTRDLESLKFFRHAVPECTNMLIDKRKQIDSIVTKLGADMSVPDGRLEDVMRLYREGLKEYNLESAIWGHIGDNHLHVNILPRDGEDYKKGKELYSKWAQAVTDMGGAVSAEHGVGKIKAPYLEVMYGKKHIIEMAEMKRVFDPHFIFGNGNLFASDVLGEDFYR